MNLYQDRKKPGNRRVETAVPVVLKAVQYLVICSVRDCDERVIVRFIMVRLQKLRVEFMNCRKLTSSEIL